MRGGARQGRGIAVTQYLVCGVGVVLNRAFGRYSRFLNAATVVGTSNFRWVTGGLADARVRCGGQTAFGEDVRWT